jgi:hypothetical protein
MRLSSKLLVATTLLARFSLAGTGELVGRSFNQSMRVSPPALSQRCCQPSPGCECSHSKIGGALRRIRRLRSLEKPSRSACSLSSAMTASIA